MWKAVALGSLGLAPTHLTRQITPTAQSRSSTSPVLKAYSTPPLQKPLGIVLEESDLPGLLVADVVEQGSAYNQVVPGDRLLGINGDDLSAEPFDNVMAAIADAPSPVTLDLDSAAADDADEPPAAAADAAEPPAAAPPAPMPRSATITLNGEALPSVKTGVLLRGAIMDSKGELYKGLAKLTNCGGVGQCGTCLVDVVSGTDSLSSRTAVEEAKLKGKPASYRLACQAILTGDVEVKAASAL